MKISIHPIVVVLTHIIWCVDARLPSNRKLQVTQEAPRNTVIENSYLVELKSKSESTRQNVMALAGSTMDFEYSHVFDGFSISDASQEVVDSLLESPDVEAIYEDVQNELYQDKASRFTQENAPWGLDRVDARSGLDGLYRYDTKAEDVTIFIVDSGVLSSHSEFSGRFWGCRDFVGTNCRSPGLHGTHVAGTAAGTTYGIAKGAQIADFKVCTGSGCPTSAIVAAMDAIVALGRSKSVANLSLGGPRSTVMNNAMVRAVNAGVVVVVAAGNENADACNVSPASASGVISVGSTTRSDSRSDFSNFGSCVDVFAPGSNIQSASNNGGTTSLSGTSMASPHVAGLAALFVSEGVSAGNEIIRQATTGVVSNAGRGSPNRLAFSGIDTVPFPAPPPSSPPAEQPTGGGMGGGGCFSASSTVIVSGKGSTKMADLKIEDQVLTAQGYESIYAFAHNDDETVAEFLQLQTNTGILEVTGEHLIYLHGKPNPRRADSIQVEDTLQGKDGAAVVKEIRTVQKAGLHAPLTPSGTLIVSDIMASCYISFFPDRDPEVLDRNWPIGALLSHHTVAHMGLSLVRIGCPAISSALCTTYSDRGMLSFIQFGQSLFEFFSSQHEIVQTILIMAYLVVLSPLVFLEYLFGSRAAGFGVIFGVACCWFNRHRSLRVSEKITKKTN